MKKKIYSICFIIFLVGLTLTVFLVVNLLLEDYLPFSVITIDGCGDRNICDTYPAGKILVFLSLITLITSVVALKKIANKKHKIITQSFLILFLLFIILMGSNSASCGHIAWRSGGETLYNLRLSQELYYDELGKYAENAEELLLWDILKHSPGIAPPKYVDRYDNPIVDEDGEGWDGGDNDPNTWSAQVYIRVPQYNKCKKVSDGYFVVCNQDRCSNLTNTSF